MDHVEGYRRGKRAELLFIVDWDSQLKRSLADVPADLGLPTSTDYVRVWSEELIAMTA